MCPPTSKERHLHQVTALLAKTKPKALLRPALYPSPSKNGQPLFSRKLESMQEVEVSLERVVLPQGALGLPHCPQLYQATTSRVGSWEQSVLLSESVLGSRLFSMGQVDIGKAGGGRCSLKGHPFPSLSIACPVSHRGRGEQPWTARGKKSLVLGCQWGITCMRVPNECLHHSLMAWGS